MELKRCHDAEQADGRKKCRAMTMQQKTPEDSARLAA
jgi:hypothetical protein